MQRIVKYMILSQYTNENADMLVKKAFSMKRDKDVDKQLEEELHSYVRGGLEILDDYFKNVKDYLLVRQKKLLLLTLSKSHRIRNLINFFLYLLQDYLHIQLKISKTIYQLVTYSLSMIVNVEDSSRVLF